MRKGTKKGWQAGRRCGGVRGHDDHALRSMAGPHRGKGESFLTSVATGQSASVDEEGVDAVKSGLAQWKTRKQCAKACVAMTGPAPPHGRLRTSRWAVVPRTTLRLLHLLSTLDITGGTDKDQTLGWLGFGAKASAAALIAGGR
jgi:hypothetical protein